jgi:hypothetical protein
MSYTSELIVNGKSYKFFSLKKAEQKLDDSEINNYLEPL